MLLGVPKYFNFLIKHILFTINIIKILSIKYIHLEKKYLQVHTNNVTPTELCAGANCIFLVIVFRVITRT